MKSQARTKVAVLIGTLEVGGAELDIARNFPRLDRDEFDVVVVTFGEAGSLAPEVEQQGIRVIARKKTRVSPLAEDSLSFESDKGARSPDARALRRARFSRMVRAPFYMAHVTFWVARVFAAERVDIAHFFLPHSYAYGMFACAMGRPSARTVMSRLSLNFYKDSHRFLAWLERTVLHRHVHIAIGNCRPILDELVEEGVDESKLRLLHNGIDPRPFARTKDDRESARLELGLAADAFVMTAVGNLHTYKGHSDLIEACALAADSLPAGWRLLIAGRDHEDNLRRYERQVAVRGLSENIVLLGPCDTVPVLLMASDVFVQPSHHEGLPNAIIEAMAASLPVVATTVGGIPEVVIPAGEKGETGWLVPPHEPEMLAVALVSSASDPIRRAKMGERALLRVLEEFSLARSVSCYESIYRELLL